MSLTHTRLGAAVRVMRYYNSVPLTGTGIAPVRAGQTTSLLVVMIVSRKPPAVPWSSKKLKRSVEKAETTNKQYTRN